MQELLAPHSPLMLVKKTHSSVPHTATVEISFLQHCSTNGKLRIPVEVQPSTPSTWLLSPTRLGIRPRDLGLSNEYTLSHCGFSAASRHELASTSRQCSLLTAIPTLQHSTKLLVFFCCCFLFFEHNHTPSGKKTVQVVTTPKCKLSDAVRRSVWLQRREDRTFRHSDNLYVLITFQGQESLDAS